MPWAKSFLDHISCSIGDVKNHWKQSSIIERILYGSSHIHQAERNLIINTRSIHCIPSAVWAQIRTRMLYYRNVLVLDVSELSSCDIPY